MVDLFVGVDDVCLLCLLLFVDISIQRLTLLELLQGCCFSRGFDGVYLPAAIIGNRHGEASRNNTASNATSNPSTHPQADNPSTTRTSRQPRRVFPHPIPLSEHYNQPIRPHVWKSKRRIWSRQELLKERTEFFETRVTGRSEIWQALAAVIEHLRVGDLQTAQTVLDAVGVTVPTGDLCEGCYDERGTLYKLPEAIVSDPANITDVPEEEESKYRAWEDLGDDESSSKLDMGVDSDDELVGEMERKRDEKGKRSERDLIRVKTRLSDRGGPDMTVTIGKDQTVGLLARKVHSEAKVCPFRISSCCA